MAHKLKVFKMMPHKVFVSTEISNKETLRLLANGVALSYPCYVAELAGIKKVSLPPNLKVISRVGVGTDNIDLTECLCRNIKVYTTESPYRAVAEFTIKQMLNIGGLFDKSIGIIGYGKIGKKVDDTLQTLAGEVYVADINDDLKYLLGNVDIITLHASAKEMILGRKEFMQMRHGVYIINTARSHLIDEDILYHALLTGKVAGAALDDWKDPRLKECKNAILTNHIAANAERERMEREAVDNLLEGLCGL